MLCETCLKCDESPFVSWSLPRTMTFPVVFTSAAKRSEWPRQVDCNLETWAAQKLANPWTCSWILGHLVNPLELHHDSGVDLSVDSKSLLAWLNRYIGDLLCDCMLYCTIMYIQCIHAWPILSEWLTPTQIPPKTYWAPSNITWPWTLYKNTIIYWTNISQCTLVGPRPFPVTSVLRSKRCRRFALFPFFQICQASAHSGHLWLGVFRHRCSDVGTRKKPESRGYKP